jgi:hypothetical protein
MHRLAEIERRVRWSRIRSPGGECFISWRTFPSEAENITVERRKLGQHLDLVNRTGRWRGQARQLLW